MATNIPPHNITEVINGCLAYIDDEDISIEGLMAHIPGPDFPTAAIINGRRGIEEAYRTGAARFTSVPALKWKRTPKPAVKPLLFTRSRIR
jgi:DNA gyrase/topoisomerase IV subunit A